MFKKNDYIVISIICFFLGIFVVSQVMATRKYKTLIQPENNEVLAIEVSKQTKVNSELRSEVKDLTAKLDEYKSSTESSQKALELYKSDLSRLSIINGESEKSGQGIVVSINGKMGVPQVVDLINAIRNIGADVISVNDTRILVNSSFNQFNALDKYEIKVLGNSKLLKSAMERKGGIVEQIATRDISFSIEERTDLTVPAGKEIKFKYSKIVE